MKPQVSPHTHHVAANPSVIIDRHPDDLKPWPGNPRTHSDKQLVKLKASIRKFGFTAPVLIDESDFILSGHGRVQAASEMGLNSIPTRLIAGLTKTQKQAYVIADNKLAQLSGWDGALLRSELEILIRDDFDIETTGFSTAEIDVMLNGAEAPEGSNPGDLQDDDIKEEIVSRAADLWQLGHHRLFCGDALHPESYAALMEGEKAQIVITDPPYNVPIASHVCGKGKVKHQEFAMASGEMSAQEFTDFLNRAFSRAHDSSEDGAIHYFFMDWRHVREILDAALPLFGQPRQVCVWVKDNAGMGAFYRSQHEMVFVFRKGDAPHINNFELGQHGRYRTNVWEYPGVNTFTGGGHDLLALHPTVKPVSLIADALRDCSHRKGIVLDPFAGSGTVLVAAERTGRRARAIELDPRYVDVAIRRWQRVTGKQAVLTTTGQTWDELLAERLSGLAGGDGHGV